MAASHLDVGRIGEQAAAEYLSGEGFELLHCNWSCRAGEIDLIMREEDRLVFVEVKTRLACALAEQYLFANITAAKQRKLRQLTHLYLAYRYGRGPVPNHRIDVVGVLLDTADNSVISVRHLRGAV